MHPLEILDRARAKIIDRVAAGSVPITHFPAPRCRCGGPTTFGKPRCFDHVGEMPGARQVAHLVRLVVRQDARAARGCARADDVRALDVLTVLRILGARTLRRLAIDAGFVGSGGTAAACLGYVRALERVGLVRRVQLGSRRGQPRFVVELIESGRRWT